MSFRNQNLKIQLFESSLPHKQHTPHASRLHLILQILKIKVVAYGAYIYKIQNKMSPSNLYKNSRVFSISVATLKILEKETPPENCGEREWSVSLRKRLKCVIMSPLPFDIVGVSFYVQSCDSLCHTSQAELSPQPLP